MVTLAGFACIFECFGIWLLNLELMLTGETKWNVDPAIYKLYKVEALHLEIYYTALSVGSE